MCVCVCVCVANLPERGSSNAAMTCFVDRLTSHHTCSNRICTHTRTYTQEGLLSHTNRSGHNQGERYKGLEHDMMEVVCRAEYDIASLYTVSFYCFV